jgi:hypothetical protein
MSVLIHVALVLLKAFCTVLYAQLRASQREFIAFLIILSFPLMRTVSGPHYLLQDFFSVQTFFVGGHFFHVSSREIMKGREIW